MTDNIDIQRWLKAHGYGDVSDLIDKVKDKWRAEGKKTRRNWWDVLAGDSKGQSRKVAGVEFPVIRAAQERQGKQITNNAIYRLEDEMLPSVWKNTRWSNEKLEKKDEACG